MKKRGKYSLVDYARRYLNGKLEHKPVGEPGGKKKEPSIPVKLDYVPPANRFPLWPHARTENRIAALEKAVITETLVRWDADGNKTETVETRLRYPVLVATLRTIADKQKQMKDLGI